MRQLLYLLYCIMLVIFPWSPNIIPRVKEISAALKISPRRPYGG